MGLLRNHNVGSCPAILERCFVCNERRVRVLRAIQMLRWNFKRVIESALRHFYTLFTFRHTSIFLLVRRHCGGLQSREVMDEVAVESGLCTVFGVTGLEEVLFEIWVGLVKDEALTCRVPRLTISNVGKVEL